MKQIATMSVFCFLLMASGAKAQNSNASREPMTGTWQCVAHGGQNGDIPFTLHMEQHGPKHIYGWVTAQQGTADLTTGSRKGNHFQIEIDTDENQYTLTGILEDSQLSGTWKQNGQEKGPWEGKKTSSSESQ
jgi:hypothetical protein